jgi:hypothetical protein
LAAAVALFFAELCPAGIHPTGFKLAAAEPAGAQYPGNVVSLTLTLIFFQHHGSEPKPVLPGGAGESQ